MDTRIYGEVKRIALRRDGAGPMMAAFEGRHLTKLQQQAPHLWKAIQGLALNRTVMKVLFSQIEPNQAVARHVDGGPHYERYHLPITAPVYWWDEEDGDQVFPVGKWSGPVPFWKLHSVHNPTDEVRLTVIVDLA